MRKKFNSCFGLKLLVECILQLERKKNSQQSICKIEIFFLMQLANGF
jgi:hypothetical protein